MDLIRGFARYLSSYQEWTSGAETDLRASKSGALMVAHAEPTYHEYARLGRVWICSAGVKANFVAAVQDDPGTAHAYALYNPLTSGVVLSVIGAAAYSDAGGTALGGALVLSAPQSEATAIVANSTGVVVGNAAGSSRASPLFYSTSGSLDAAGAWTPVAASPAPAATQVGALAYVSGDLGGRFLVKPGCKLGAHIISGATAKFGITLTVVELTADLS